MKKIFIDGSAGTTGLRILDRLQTREDIELIVLPDELRKDAAARKDAINSSDITILCLPDAAAKESVSFVENDSTVIIDTSTAHRTAEGWTYGFPELVGEDKIRNSKRIANPGCHASGVISLLYPLVQAGIINKDAKLSATSITGYSGGGKSMIAEYEAEDRDALLEAPRAYGLAQAHKHLPEIKQFVGLEYEPVFVPIVAPYYAGMEVSIPVFFSDINGDASDIAAAYKEAYQTGLVSFIDNADESGFLSAAKYAGYDNMEISIQGGDERMTLVSRFDNLGKGASGAALQNMNIVLGTDPQAGLDIRR